jgi:CRISPR-associated protein Cmr2
LCEAFWQAKIWGLVDNINLDVLEDYAGNKSQPYFNALKEIHSPSSPPNVNELADLITEASDRAVLNAAGLQVSSPTLKVAHLLSGAELSLSVNLADYDRLKSKEKEWQERERERDETIDSRQLFWWLWRCLPQATSQQLGEDALLMPAATILPDASVWSQASLTAALSGTLTGYERSSKPKPTQSRPYLATFSFSPVQELIKASRKMRDFWAGSWVLHYLSAKVCWKLASLYGPDSLIYPNLYQQPLIDCWLLQTWPNFESWVRQPSDSSLLTAGFPNVIVAVLPEGEVHSAMQTARQTLMKEWLAIGHLVFEELKGRNWTRKLEENSKTWEGWLGSQWQTYWTALPVGIDELTNRAIPESEAAQLQDWLDPLNRVCQLKNEPDKPQELFLSQELEFIRAVYQKDPSISVNVGSWWPYIFDQLRFAAGSVKSSRVWKLPTAFLPRSTVSGMGSVVYPYPEQRYVTEGDTARYWERHAGLFDGIEELNATETLKRGVHQVLPRLLFPHQPNRWHERLPEFYPDLSSGVAGWLRTHPEARDYFRSACGGISQAVDWTTQSPEAGDEPPATQPWGIPWVAQHYPDLPNPRLLNAGWLIDDFQPTNPNPAKPFTRNVQKQVRHTELQRVSQIIGQYFAPGNNPTDWYVLAAGDGDGMSKWLNGEQLNSYQDYMPRLPDPPNSSDPQGQAIYNAFNSLISLKKRMGPATHNALSRALLDFSNQLVPYLTEQRYAGRLIYSGGDDVLAYTNLWEWDSWLWDIRECFRGANDPVGEFNHDGDYWRWQSEEPPRDARGNSRLPKRPLFTMGGRATLSFGLVIAHHSVPLAIALENLWSAESSAKAYQYQQYKKDALQVRVLFGNGNTLKARSRFEGFNLWRMLLRTGTDGAIFEQAAQLWRQHPAPTCDAIQAWTIAFVKRRDLFKGQESARVSFTHQLASYLQRLSETTPEDQRDETIQNWLKLTAFVLRNRQIEINPRRAA